MDIQTAVSALGSLAQASRLAVFQRLVELGPEGAYPGDLAQALQIPATTLSFHLKTLSHAGLIEAEQQGRFIRYRANFERMQALIDFLTRNCCGGDAARCLPVAPDCAVVAGPSTARKRC
ncbi:ArsR/SmtB family transcription factor [Lysobacter korlensis]|uniref:ArsR/SmtB family transcription factor n=1 Tax=Lysobacter korlensis TaxID=553636 RepID=A0ABV6RQL6_9GAMM